MYFIEYLFRQRSGVTRQPKNQKQGRQGRKGKNQGRQGAMLLPLSRAT
jgi:hypothetical protein